MSAFGIKRTLGLEEIREIFKYGFPDKMLNQPGGSGL